MSTMAEFSGADIQMLAQYLRDRASEPSTDPPAAGSWSPVLEVRFDFLARVALEWVAERSRHNPEGCTR